LCVYLRKKIKSEYLLTYGEEFIEKPISSYGFIIAGKISDQLSYPNFFKKYDPKVIICLDGPLPYLLTSRIKQTKYLSIFADARSENLPTRRLKIIEKFRKGLFRNFDFIFTENEMVARKLFQNSVEQQNIEGMGLLQSSIAPLPFSNNENILSNLKGKPIWAALNIHEQEIELVLEAHKQVLRAAFQYCLIISLSNPNLEGVLKDHCSRLDLRLSRVEKTKAPNEAIQVYFSKQSEGNTEFMRLSPIVFYGNTIAGLDEQEDPLIAASLCCGILHGPNISKYSLEYNGLRSVGAALQIQNSSELAAELNKLYSVDKAANMGVAALDFVSSGADNTDKVVKLVFEYLKHRELI
jgi:3-deoxy-D-manno-octulosonic-acid transferase